jgi:hypothetical protein
MAILTLMLSFGLLSNLGDGANAQAIFPQSKEYRIEIRRMFNFCICSPVQFVVTDTKALIRKLPLLFEQPNVLLQQSR